MAGPLDGVRILDLTANFMGPFATLLLADLGADVIKVESPAGDTTRGVGPSRHRGMSVIFLHLNRNKRSIAINLKNPAGAQALKKMIGDADVLVHSLRPAAMQRLGLSYAEARALNDRIIYCGMFGFGQDGPYADRPAYDDLIQAAVGMPMLQSRKVGEPTYVATAIADRVVGMAAANAVNAALYRRERTGTGQEVQVPMFETFAQFVLGDHLYGHTFDPPIGDWGYARMMNADRRPYRTLDGQYLGVNIYIDKHWHRFFELAGRPELKEDPRFADITGRTENIGTLYELVASTLASKTADEWLALLTEADVPVIRMHTPETILEDPHMKAVGFFIEENHPTEGPLRGLGIPQTWSESQPDLRHHAPRLGQHSVEVLAQFGFAGADIDRLVRDGAVLASNDDCAHAVS